MALLRKTAAKCLCIKNLPSTFSVHNKEWGQPRQLSHYLSESDVYIPSTAYTNNLQRKSHEMNLFEEGSAVSSSTFFDAVDKLGPSSNGTLRTRSYRTKAHSELYDILLYKTRFLCEGRYRQKQGIGSAAIVGSKGIGKTTVLSSYVNLCQLVEPRVLPVFVTMNHIGTRNNPLRKHTLAENVINEVKRHGIPVRSHGGQPHRELMVAMRDTGKYLLLLVDELDQLYRLDPKTPAGECANESLFELAFLGDQDTGLASTIICGSSAMLPLLITRNTNDPEFPMLSGAPSLNGNKYLTRRIHTSPPTDLNVIANITGLEMSPVNFGILRQLAFAFGSTAREVERMFVEASDKVLARSVMPAESLQGFNTLHSEDRNLLRKLLLREIIKKNDRLIKGLIRDNHLDANAVRNIAWEQEFKPLLFEEGRRCCSGLSVESQDKFLNYLLHMSDRSWISLDGMKDSAPEKIYPTTLLQVTAQHLEDAHGCSWSDTLGKYLSNIRSTHEYQQAFSIFVHSVGMIS